MSATDKLFGGSIPEIYERLLVPLLFETYANDLAERVVKNHPGDVLETAAGTGVLTRAIASRLPLSARIVATDLNQPMLDKAKTLARGDNRIEWRQADAEALPFANESFDAVVCQFGMMFLPDKVRGYAEARRVLRPGGRSSSMFGTRFRKMILPTSSRKRSRRSSPKILRGFSRAPLMVTMTESRFVMI